MDQTLDLKRLLALRKLTRAVADLLRAELNQYLATLFPLLRPAVVLGQHVRSDPPMAVRDAEQALADLKARYEQVATSPRYGLRKDFTLPLQIVADKIEAHPLETTATFAAPDGAKKAVAITSPCTWVLNYSGYPPGKITHVSFGLKRLKELLANRSRAPEELQQVVLHVLAMHSVLTRQAGLARVLEALRFPVRTLSLPEFDPLPIPCLVGPLATVRPPDATILESTEISGVDVFEEVVNLDDLSGLGDPLRDRLVALVREHVPDAPGVDAAPAASS